MRNRVLKNCLRIVLASAILLGVFVLISLLIIDRSQPAVAGTLSSDELSAIRRSVRRCAIETPVRWLSQGEFSESWYLVKKLYTYRVLSVEVVDPDTVLVFTRTNRLANGRREPDFFVRRIDGTWQAAPPGPML
jgi:hypothetical protein